MTQEDLKQIKNIVENESEKLAQIVNKGFKGMQEQINERFEKVDEKFGQIDEKFGQIDEKFEQLENKVDYGFREVNMRLSNLEQDMTHIKNNLVYRHEFEDLMARVKYLEIKMGIESGK